MSCARALITHTTPVTAEEVGAHLKEGEWRSRFDATALAQGGKLARGRRVARVHAEWLPTEDLEIIAQVSGRDEKMHEVTLALWPQGDRLQLETTCTCPVGIQCPHAVATLDYFAKGSPGQRLATALGDTPHAERMTQGQHLDLPDSVPPPAIEPRGDAETPRFHLRVETRESLPGQSRLAQVLVPEVFALARARYGEHTVALEPSGILPPIVTPTGKLRRNRAAEMEAIRTLYALDLLPRDLPTEGAPANQPSRVWIADPHAWPHLGFYWQRFQHEATPALEKRGWELRFSPGTSPRPLVFRAESWRAEIVEEGRGWFTLSAGFEIDGESFDLQPILATLLANRFLEVTKGKPDGQEFMVFLSDGRGLVLPIGRFRNLLKTLGELTAFRFTNGPLRLHKMDAAQLASQPDLELEASVPPALNALRKNLTLSPPAGKAPLPTGLRATLRDYQQSGFRWMQFLARQELHGILADDMGLGKTLQTLTHLLAEQESHRTEGRPSLVVAPTSVVENWQREAARFTPGLRVTVLQGPRRHNSLDRLHQVDLAITSYALLSRDLDRLSVATFHLLILDEAQHIKNAETQVSRAARRLKARHRLCLSGTPMENHLGELWSLMQFLMPGWLGSRQRFQETFRTPIERDRNEARRRALAAKVGPLILRRTKQEVAKELPPKTHLLHSIELTDAQKDLYETVRATMDKHVRKALELQGQQSQIVFLDALLKLRQICCHPRLLEESTLSRDCSSSKLDYLLNLLKTLREEGHCVLLFSQFTSMLAIIEDHLQNIDCPTLKLTGATRDRQALVEAFQAGQAEVFLISLKAGGTGLNLTGADAVIHYDPWWNPAAEDQATDRAYRIGQDRPVIVHKLICKDTVEERIQQMQARKHHLASGFLSGATQTPALTPESLAQLLAPLPDAT